MRTTFSECLYIDWIGITLTTVEMASRPSHEYIGNSDTQTNINNMMNREQKLKYLKNDLLLCHSLNEYDQKYDQNIERLKECVSSQEIKLRQLRALKAQCNKQTNNNAIIHSELESIRTVFNEKEKELAVALTKVDSLTRQLEELRKGNTTNSYQINDISNGKHAAELEKLRQELLYRTKLTEQQNQEILHKKGLLTQRQSEMIQIDKRIGELQQRLARKRQLNQHLTQMHCTGNGVYSGNVILRSSLNANAGHSHKSIHSRPLSANIAAVEPLQREQNRINESDELISKNQDFSGCKMDPKYQTLPYNTKFNLRQLQRMGENHLINSKLEASKNEYELSSNEIYAINNNLIKNMANNSYNGSEQLNGNNSNSKLMNLKQPYMEERPSPSGSSGSSDRASIQNHNSASFYKIQSSIVNSNFALNANQQKIFNAPYLENDNLKHSKSINLINNRNMQNSNQNLSHNYRVPTVSQTQSYIASNLTKVPHLTLNKLKPILPPKPSIPVKPIPPPRQTPNHSINAQSDNHDSIDNSFSFYETNANINNIVRKSANLPKTNATAHNFNQNYGSSHGIQRGSDGSNELLIQRSLFNKQQSNVFEDKTCLNSFNADLGNETTDGCNINGQSVIGCDTNSSTSSLSSISVTNSGNNDNNVRSNASINNVTQTACADKENFSNANKSFNSNTANDLRNTSNNSNQSNKSSGINNLMLDWHKVKRRPFIADNKLEQELAIHSTIPNSFIDNKLKPQIELNSECQSSSVSEDNITVNCDGFQNKPEESSKVDAKFIQEPRDMNLSGFSNENNKENVCDKEQNNDELSCLPPKCIGGVKRTKGNLKSQQINIGDHIGISRRVSFDPLALLLDAALEGELELVKKTAAEVPNASAANDEGITALHNSICAGHSDIVNYLVENGCDVNAQDSDGWTPLHCAASCNNLAMVKFLVEHGACIFATTLSDQETAAEKCEEDEEGFDGCSQYLYGIQEKLGIMNNGVVYAVYDYDSQNADELSFKESDKIIVLRKGDDQEREWWWSKLNDREGYIPRNLIGLYRRVRGEKLKSFNEQQNE